MSKSKSVKEAEKRTTKAIDLLWDEANMIAFEVVHMRQGCPDSDEDHEALEDEAWGMFEEALRVAREEGGPACDDCTSADLIKDLAAMARTMVYLANHNLQETNAQS